jgi:hypothetical protein
MNTIRIYSDILESDKYVSECRKKILNFCQSEYDNETIDNLCKIVNDTIASEYRFMYELFKKINLLSKDVPNDIKNIWDKRFHIETIKSYKDLD